jgi:hypothetical protein
MRYRIVRAHVMCGVALGIILLQVARPGPAAIPQGLTPFPQTAATCLCPVRCPLLLTSMRPAFTSSCRHNGVC